MHFGCTQMAKRLVLNTLIKALHLHHKYIVKVFAKMMPIVLELVVTIIVDALKSVLFVIQKFLNLTARLHFTRNKMTVIKVFCWKIYRTFESRKSNIVIKRMKYRIEIIKWLTILGLNGGLIFLSSRSFHFMSRKKEWCLIASSPPCAVTQPRRFDTFFCINCK